ncbi:MAG: hypothetical protein ISR55_11675 [Bacteroidetes bacterium]|nr:hypothetical protein [Bacteroidota bacterium]MBL6964476.1 hypothetical protein [Bacteroidota bacterium]
MNRIYRYLIHAAGLFLLVSSMLLFENCNDTNNDYHDIPDVYVYFTLNLDLPIYNSLTIPGGHFYLNDEGYKGIIMYHNLDDTYLAFERTCTYQPLNDCSTITVDQSGIFMRCGHYDGSDFINCCESTFDMNGFVLKNPALYPLKRYNVSQLGNVLTISN